MILTIYYHPHLLAFVVGLAIFIVIKSLIEIFL
jgi:hypothetical protein